MADSLSLNSFLRKVFELEEIARNKNLAFSGRVAVKGHPMLIENYSCTEQHFQTGRKFKSEGKTVQLK